MKNLKENQTHFKTGHRPVKRGSQALLALVTVIVSLAVVGAAFAFTLGNVDGTWGDIDGVTAGPGTLDVIGGATTSGSSATLYPSRADHTYVRNAATCRGDPDGDTAFADWTHTASVVWTGLGSHTSTCPTANSLIISEYVRDYRSGLTDYLGIEIYNRTGAAVNLSNYSLRLFSGGRNSFTTIALNNVNLANGDVYVLVSSNAAGLTNAEDQTFSMDNAYRAVALFNENETAGARCNRWATGPGDTPTALSSGDKGVQTGPNTDENQVRYGRDAYNPSSWQSLSCDLTNFAEQSGFGFDGNNTPGAPAANTPFYLGKFTHYNNQVFSTDDGGSNANAFTSVDLSVNIPVNCDDGVTPPSTLTFSSHFVLDETSNSAGTCVYPGSSVCPDKVTVTQPTSQTFTCADGDYTVNILGFTKETVADPDCTDAFNPANIATEYITEEDTDNRACLWAEITKPTADVTPEKTCANFNTEDPVYTIVTTNLGPGSARQVKIVDVIPSEVGFSDPFVYSSQLTTTLGGTINQGTCSFSGQTVTCELLTSLPATSYDPAARWTVVLHVGSITTEPVTVTNSVTASTVTTDVNTLNNTDTCSSEAPTGITVLPPVAAAVDQAIQVDWTSTSEVEILGFNLYRSITLDGPRTLVYPVQAKHPGKQIGDSYQYIDTDVQPGGVYYYWLEVRLKDGSTQVMEPASASLPEVAIKFYLPTVRR